MRAVVVSENMGPPLDEGIRKFATSLVDGLSHHCEAFGIATGEEFAGQRDGPIMHAPGGKLFGAPGLRDALDAISPDVVIYVPSASGTLFSFLRARALRRIRPDAQHSLVLAQPRRHTAPVRRLLSRAAPGTVFCQSEASLDYMRSAGIEARFLPSGVDLERFHPASSDARRLLRRKYGLPEGEYLVFHAGHLKAGRNAHLLAQLEGIGRGVMLAGRSMGLDPELRRAMKDSGVIVIDSYVEDVHELYQAVDCYLFPVREEDSAMEFPLSVLEAMACDLPVVAYPYGGLPYALLQEGGLFFAESDEEMIDAIRAARVMRSDTRAQAGAFGWPRIAASVLEALEEERDARAFAVAV